MVLRSQRAKFGLTSKGQLQKFELMSRSQNDKSRLYCVSIDAPGGTYNLVSVSCLSFQTNGINQMLSAKSAMTS